MKPQPPDHIRPIIRTWISAFRFIATWIVGKRNDDVVGRAHVVPEDGAGGIGWACRLVPLEISLCLPFCAVDVWFDGIVGCCEFQWNFAKVVCLVEIAEIWLVVLIRGSVLPFVIILDALWRILVPCVGVRWTD